VVSATDRGLDFMVKHGIKGVIGGGSALMADNSVLAYQQAQQRAGIDVPLGTDLCFGISFHLAPTREQAIAEATPYYHEHAKMFAPLGFMGPMEDGQLEALGRRGGFADSGLAGLETSCERGAWYCGPPEGFVEFLQELGEKYPGLEAVNVQSSMGTPQDVMVEQLQRFAADVMGKV
jgi:alkanesulfonate monooxygenase SsuD/methylene tetrahydromethanopterin reductase-like flavin-dependent oxidoreductase (luciferase family)